MIIEYATPEELVEFLGGEIIVKNNIQIWKSPIDIFKHPKYRCRLHIESGKYHNDITIIGEEK